MVMDFLFEKVDLYGQPIQFSYKNQSNFTSGCGGITSIFIIVFLFIYLLYLLLEIINKQNPLILQSGTSSNAAEKLQLIMDPYLQWNRTDKIKENFTDSEKAVGQIAIGFYDTKNENYIDIDPTYFYMIPTFISSNKNSTNYTKLYFSKCSSFYNINDTVLKKINLTWCIYDTMNLVGSLSDDIYNYTQIQVNICSNNTIKNDIIPRKIEFSSNFNSSYLSPYSYIPFLNIKTNNDMKDYNSLYPNSIYPYVSNIGPNDYNKSLNIICKPRDTILKYLANLKIEIYSINNVFNLTEINNPVTSRVIKSDFYFLSTLLITYNLYYNKNKYMIYNSMLPIFLKNSSIVYYGLQIDSEEKYYTNESKDTSSVIFTFNIISSQSSMDTTVIYDNILDVLGIVGGISKIIMMISSIFVVYIADIKFKESLINEFYSVIDPNKDDLIKRDFSKFLEFKYDNFDILVSKTNQQTFLKIDDLNNPLHKFFNKDVILKIYNYKHNSEKDEDNIFINNENNNENDENKTNNMIKVKPKKNQSLTEIEYLKYAIVYDVFKYEIYNGMVFNHFELFSIIFCYCCLTTKLRKKLRIFKKASKRLERDTDFLSIIKSFQEFDSFKKTFFEADQFNLFNSLVNCPITIKEINEIENKKEELKKKIRDCNKKINDLKTKIDNSESGEQTKELILKKKKEIIELEKNLDKIEHHFFKENDVNDDNLDSKINKLFDSLNNLTGTDERYENETDEKLLKILQIKKNNEQEPHEKSSIELFIMELDKNKKERKNILEKNLIKNEENIVAKADKNIDYSSNINAQFFWDKFANKKNK